MDGFLPGGVCYDPHPIHLTPSPPTLPPAAMLSPESVYARFARRGVRPDGRAFPAGKDMTCGNWTKGGAEGSAMVGHGDRLGLRDDASSRSWNTAHPSRGCDMPSLRSSGGGGLIYCFAAN